jgi:hypothetical protein
MSKLFSDRAQLFALGLVAQYLLVSILFAKEKNWKKMLYFIGCAIKDISVLMFTR